MVNHVTCDMELRQRAWDAAAQVVDPEIPVLTIADLGVLRDVSVHDGEIEVAITPTYSGCPAMQVIADAVKEALQAHGLDQVRIVSRLSPAWTTDWMSETGKAALKGYGIAPPVQQAIDISGLHAGIRRRAAPEVSCPHCGSPHTQLISEFGSTPCKALDKCLDCREPFDYFKCH
jgi:ring-1,2-phenylacetyl-CoA epoxidase subunit PaaD